MTQNHILKPDVEGKRCHFHRNEAAIFFLDQPETFVARFLHANTHPPGLRSTESLSPDASGVYMCPMRHFPFRSYPNSTKVLHVLLTNSKSSGLSRALFVHCFK